MNLITYRFTLDLAKHGSQVVLSGMKVGDTNRAIDVALTMNGEPYYLGADNSAQLRARVCTEQGEFQFTAACQIKDNRVFYIIDPDMLSAAGDVQVDLEIGTAGAAIFSTAKFVFFVTGTVSDDGEIPEDQYTSVITALAAAERAEKRSISKVKKNNDGNLVISLMDGTEYDVGNVIGPQGDKGDVDHTALAEVRRYKFDYDRNGVVDMDDSIYLKRHIEDPSTYPIPEWCNADANGDGVVDLNDAVYVLEAVNNPDKYPGMYDTVPDAYVTQKLSETSQGRSAKYNFTTPGWKRILNMIRATNGAIDLGLASGNPYRMVQALALDITGFVKYPEDTTDSKPTIIKRYENRFGEDDAVKDHPFKVSKIRIGYPKKGTEFPETDGNTNYKVNPVNCYVDIYVDFVSSTGKGNLYFTGVSSYAICDNQLSDGCIYVVKDWKDEGNGDLEIVFEGGEYIQVSTNGLGYVLDEVAAGTKLYFEEETDSLYFVKEKDHNYIAFNMNYAGFANSHNCEAITEETDATDTGIYGEELTYYEVDVDSMPYFVQSPEVAELLNTEFVKMDQVYSGTAAGYGVRMHKKGFLCIDQASNGEISAGTSKYKPITANNVKTAFDCYLPKIFTFNFSQDPESELSSEKIPIGSLYFRSKNDDRYDPYSIDSVAVYKGDDENGDKDWEFLYLSN